MSRGKPNEGWAKDSWEIDWDKRQSGRVPKVWARNERSMHASARTWHWVAISQLTAVGIEWRSTRTGRAIDGSGYVILSPSAMSDDEIELADKHDLWRGRKPDSQALGNVAEHRLVAVKKFGGIPGGCVVRHMNGVKDDNRPENLVLGTQSENVADHNTARLLAMYWHNRANDLEHMLVRAGIDVPQNPTATDMAASVKCM